MVTKGEIIQKIKQVKPVLTNEYHVKKIGLFGSYSKGDQTEESDIDLLVEFEKPIGWKFFSLEEYLEKLLGRKIDLVTRKAIKRQLKSSILHQIEYL